MFVRVSPSPLNITLNYWLQKSNFILAVNRVFLNNVLTSTRKNVSLWGFKTAVKLVGAKPAIFLYSDRGIYEYLSGLTALITFANHIRVCVCVVSPKSTWQLRLRLPICSPLLYVRKSQAERALNNSSRSLPACFQVLSGRNHQKTRFKKVKQKRECLQKKQKQKGRHIALFPHGLAGARCVTCKIGKL